MLVEIQIIDGYKTSNKPNTTKIMGTIPNKASIIIYKANLVSVIQCYVKVALSKILFVDK